MPVWIVLARPPCGELYIVGVFGSEGYAHEHASRYLRQHPVAEVLVQRYWVINGSKAG
jgi:hypothetical protein